MPLALLAMLAGPAWGIDDLVVEVGPPVEVGVDGRHGRPFLGADGLWHLAHGRSGSLHDVVLNEDLTADLSTAGFLVDGAGRFVDHGLAQCPDGSLLHAASANLERPDDSAAVTWISADLEPGPTVWVVDRDPTHVTNDMAVVCTAELRAVAFAGEGDWDLEIPQRNWLHVLSEATLAGEAASEIVPMHEAERINGTSLVWDAASEQLVSVAMPGGSSLRATLYDRDLRWSGRISTSFRMEDDRQAYWSAGTLQVGELFVVVHLARRFDQGFAQDQGDIALTLLGPDFLAIGSVMLTAYEPPVGAMRPALARDGDTLVVAWDRDGRFEAARVRLDLDAIAALSARVPQDTAEPDLSEADDAGDDGPPADAGGAPEGGCQVAAAALPLPAAALVLLALGRRRC